MAWLRILGIVLCLTVAWEARAERRIALVIANGDYAKAALANPTTDADLVRPALERMGFQVKVVKNADLATFDAALGSFEAEARGADIALFYFAGHGFAVSDGLQARNYLMSTSADVTSTSDRVIRAGGVALDEVIASVTASARVTLVFVDACRNDPRVRAGNAGRGLARIPDAGGAVFVGLSTRLGDTAADGDAGEGSPFAKAFAAKMPTPGLRLDDAFSEVKKAVIEATGGDQRPEANDDLDDQLILVRSEVAVMQAASTPHTIPAEQTQSKDLPQSSTDDKTAYEHAVAVNTCGALEAFGRAYPHSFYAELAKERTRAVCAAPKPEPQQQAAIAPEPPEQSSLTGSLFGEEWGISAARIDGLPEGWEGHVFNPRGEGENYCAVGRAVGRTVAGFSLFGQEGQAMDYLQIELAPVRGSVGKTIYDQFAGSKQSVSLFLDSSIQGTAEAVITDEVILLDLASNRNAVVEWIRWLKEGRSLTFRPTSGASISIPLDGSSQALDALLDCISKLDR